MHEDSKSAHSHETFLCDAIVEDHRIEESLVLPQHLKDLETNPVVANLRVTKISLRLDDINYLLRTRLIKIYKGKVFHDVSQGCCIASSFLANVPGRGET